MSEFKHVYMYGVTKNRLETHIDGLKEQPVYTIKCKNVYAVVSSFDDEIVDPIREHVFAHMKVLSEVMHEQDIIPMSFGNVFQKKKSVLSLLNQAYIDLLKLFPRVKGKIEYGLRAFWNEEKEIENLKMSPELQREIHSYKDKIALGEQVNDLLEMKKEKFLDDLLTTVKPISLNCKENRVIGDSMVFNVAILVKEEEAAHFNQVLQEWINKHENELEMRFSGPWPPYNFIRFRVEIYAR